MATSVSMFIIWSAVWRQMAHSNQVPWGEINKGTIHKGVNGLHKNRGISAVAAAAAKSLQSCPTLCDPMDCSLPGFSVHEILQARTLEWVAISFSNAWKWKVKVKSLSRVWLLATPWTAAHQAPPSTGFSGQQYWSGVPLPSPLVQYQLLKARLSSHPWAWRDDKKQEKNKQEEGEKE